METLKKISVFAMCVMRVLINLKDLKENVLCHMCTVLPKVIFLLQIQNN